MIVDGFNALLRSLVAGYAAAFAALPPLAGLAIASVLLGIGMLWVVGKTSNQRAIERAKKRMQARLLEMRLYRDEPSLLFRAQAHLLLNNARYVGQMLRPALFLALPMAVLYAHFDAVYGRRPLRVGEAALVAADTALPGQELSLAAAGAFKVDSVPVAAAATGQVVWRVRAIADGPGALTLETPDGPIAKTALAGSGSPYLSASRRASWWERLLLAPGEAGYAAGAVAGIGIAYPSRAVGLGGWDTHWAVWFLAISLVSAFLLRGFFGVVV